MYYIEDFEKYKNFCNEMGFKPCDSMALQIYNIIK